MTDAKQVCTDHSYLMIEIPGIQAYITSTGKLREMIGGSQIVNELTSTYLEKVINELSLQKVQEPDQERTNWCWLIQNAAATIRMVLPDRKTGVLFLRTYSLGVRKKFPGLPILGTVVSFPWDGGAGALLDAGREASLAIGKKRAARPLTNSLNLLPFCQSAPLDAGPVVYQKENAEAMSLPSVTRNRFAQEGNDQLTTRFNEDLEQELCHLLELEGAPLMKWAFNYEEMFAGANHSYLGILHIDGNDLGKVIENKLTGSGDAGACTRNNVMRSFSEKLDQWNQEAFRQALHHVVLKDLRTNMLAAKGSPADSYVIPVRPLVMGGDDLTIAVRADLALEFAARYAETFSKASGDEQLTVGAGMVICNHHFPFTRAYKLVEELTSSAKQLCRHHGGCSGIDFLVLTTEMEDNLDQLRDRLYTGAGSERLTRKPYQLDVATVDRFHDRVRQLHNKLPTSALRRSVDACRQGFEEADLLHREMRENILRRLGGRHNKDLMSLTEFEKLFQPESFFLNGEGRRATDLLDLYEMTRFIPGEL